MKRKLFYGFVALILTANLTGCGNNSSINLEKGKFSITCSEEDTDYAMDRKVETIYNFNEDQYAINYSVVTTQKFKDKSTYKTYKDAQKDTVKNNTSKDILYDLKTDDFKS